MIELTDRPIDVNELLKRVASPLAGAVVLFLGTVRELTQDRRTSSLDYECYPDMARKEMQRLADEASQRWPLTACGIVHRLGHMEIGEISVALAVSSPHRTDAFEAGKWLIDTLKEVVPIWKKENWVDGSVEWVHPGLENSPEKKESLRVPSAG